MRLISCRHGCATKLASLKWKQSLMDCTFLHAWRRHSWKVFFFFQKKKKDENKLLCNRQPPCRVNTINWCLASVLNNPASNLYLKRNQSKITKYTSCLFYVEAFYELKLYWLLQKLTQFWKRSCFIFKFYQHK